MVITVSPKIDYASNFVVFDYRVREYSVKKWVLLTIQFLNITYLKTCLVSLKPCENINFDYFMASIFKEMKTFRKIFIFLGFRMY